MRERLGCSASRRGPGRGDAQTPRPTRAAERGTRRDDARCVRRRTAGIGPTRETRFGRRYLTNAPFAFQIVWRLIRPLLGKELLERIHICGGPEDFAGRMVDGGAPPAALPDWIAAPRRGVQGESEGVAAGSYVAALAGEEGRPSLPSIETTLRLRTPADDPAVLDGGRTPRVIRKGFVRKRGAHSGYLRRPVELTLHATGRLVWTRGRRVVGFAATRAGVERPGSRVFVVEGPERTYRFRTPDPADARAWAEAVERFAAVAPAARPAARARVLFLFRRSAAAPPRRRVSASAPRRRRVRVRVGARAASGRRLEIRFAGRAVRRRRRARGGGGDGRDVGPCRRGRRGHGGPLANVWHRDALAHGRAESKSIGPGFAAS